MNSIFLKKEVLLFLELFIMNQKKLNYYTFKKKKNKKTEKKILLKIK